MAGLTKHSPLLLIPTPLATTLANFEFPAEDQKEHETVQLERGGGRVEKSVWVENNRGLTKEGLWGLTKAADSQDRTNIFPT